MFLLKTASCTFGMCLALTLSEWLFTAQPPILTTGLIDTEKIQILQALGKNKENALFLYRVDSLNICRILIDLSVLVIDPQKIEILQTLIHLKIFPGIENAISAVNLISPENIRMRQTIHSLYHLPYDDVELLIQYSKTTGWNLPKLIVHIPLDLDL